MNVLANIFGVLGVISLVLLGVFIYRIIKHKGNVKSNLKYGTIFLVAMIVFLYPASLISNNKPTTSAETSGKQSTVTKKRPKLRLDGTPNSYSDLHLTANSNRQVVVSGKTKRAKFVTVSQAFGNYEKYTVKIKQNKFTTTISLPNDRAKANYFVETNNGNNDDDLTEVHIKSANYEAEQTSIDQAKASSRAESSSNKSATNATKYQAKLNSLNKGTAESASYDASTNTVTWIGFDDWKTWSDSELQKSMDLLQTMTLRQESNYDISNVHIVVQLPDGTVIAKNSDTDMDLKFIK